MVEIPYIKTQNVCQILQEDLKLQDGWTDHFLMLQLNE